MKIAAVVGVKDEARLIGMTLTHLRAIGVDVVIASDTQSTDGTAEILDRYASEDWFSSFQITQDTSHEEWAHECLERAGQARVDWVMFIDADEFPIPQSGSLRNCASLAETDIVSLARFNVVLTDGGPALPDPPTPDLYPDLLMVTKPVDDFWSRVDGEPDLSWMLCRIAPRVIARPQCIAEVMLGGHDVVPSAGRLPRRAWANDLIVAHVPFSTPERFRTKVANIREAEAARPDHFPAGSALHWKRWVALAESGRLDEEFDRMVFGRQALSDLRQRGLVQSAAEVFDNAAVSEV
jgi:glycosyltransferase involved in cell wall biosynthesis